MPTYQYACTNPQCEHRFEVTQSFTDPSLTECPVCGQGVRKVYGSVGVVFKGSGFYRNDARAESKSSSVSAKSESSTSSTQGSSDSAKSSSTTSSTSSSSSAASSSSSTTSKPAASTASS